MVDPTKKKIRCAYEEYGVEEFYQQTGHMYKNPHGPQVEALLRECEPLIDYSSALDLCCGAGEVTLALRTLGYELTVGCDPYTYEAYKAATGLSCLRYTFDELLRGQLTGDYSSIICSFALHLCPEEKLYPLTYALFNLSPVLVIITPHKRPVLEGFKGVSLVKRTVVSTARKKRVSLKIYTMPQHPRWQI